MDMQQKTQSDLDAGTKGEAQKASRREAESIAAKPEPENPSMNEHMMELICERENVKEALKRVKANKGAPGIDGMTVGELPGYLREHWPAVRDSLLNGSYRPQPVRRVEIPKPDGGTRKLGIPSVLDRFVQHAMMQVLQPQWDPTFSGSSFGFRPGRSAHHAVAQAQHYIQSGYTWVVDLDLEKFFDRVNHDILMSRVAKRVSDKRVLKLIRAFLTAGVLEQGLVSASDEGTPQGGPLSPLLSNLMLDDLDREVERRGLHFARYADDCNVYVRSERAGLRVMAGLKTFLAQKLKLTVNETKSAVARPTQRKSLGFTFHMGRHGVQRSLASKTLLRFKERVRVITQRTRGASLEQVITALRRYLTGWRGYFGFCETPSVLKHLEGWLRRRLRCLVWKQWKRGPARYKALRALGVGRDLAAQAAGSQHGPWRMSNSPALTKALGNRYLASHGLPSLCS